MFELFYFFLFPDAKQTVWNGYKLTLMASKITKDRLYTNSLNITQNYDLYKA